MVKTILLIPIKILVKVLGYIAVAVIGAAAWIIGFAGLLIGKITSFLGGAAILVIIIALSIGALDKGTALIYGLYSSGAILLPVIVKVFISQTFSLKEKLMNRVEGIKLI